MASALHRHGTEHAGLHKLFATCITCEAPPGLDMLAKHIQTVVCVECMAFGSFCSMSLALHAMHTLEKAWHMTLQISLDTSVSATLHATTSLVQSLANAVMCTGP